jgi:quinol monooxygenase YgiN|tara:strand:+ start:178 stop:471 length:294 start_codon:yes stop_codon:yes gene_type:complete
MPYAVVVTFVVKPEALAEFMPLMHVNAQASLAHEEGCLQFDVATDPDRAGEVFLYEIYANRAAFDAHLASTHFKTFDAAVANMIASKEIRTYAQVAQ